MENVEIMQSLPTDLFEAVAYEMLAPTFQSIFGNVSAELCADLSLSSILYVWIQAS